MKGISGFRGEHNSLDESFSLEKIQKLEGINSKKINCLTKFNT